MQSHKQQTQPANNYLYRALVYGAKPFLYRGRVRSLLGFPEWTGGDIAYPMGLPPVGFRYADYNYPFPFTGNTPTEKSFTGNIYDFAFTHEGYDRPAGGKRMGIPGDSDRSSGFPSRCGTDNMYGSGKPQGPEIVNQLETDVQLQGKMASSGTVEDTERSEPTMNQAQMPLSNNKPGKCAEAHPSLYGQEDSRESIIGEADVTEIRLPGSSDRSSGYPSRCSTDDIYSSGKLQGPEIVNQVETDVQMQSEKKKTQKQEAQEPQAPQKQEKEIINKKVKLQEPEIVKQLETDVQLQGKMASPGTAADSEISVPTVEQARMPLSNNKPGKPAELNKEKTQKQKKEIVNEEVKLQETQVVKQRVTDVQLQSEMERPVSGSRVYHRFPSVSGTAEDSEISVPTVEQARMPLSNNKPGKRAEAPPSLSGQEDSRESIIGEAEVTEIQLPGSLERSSGFPSRCGTDNMYGSGKPQGPEIVKQLEMDVQMQSEKKKTQKQEAQEPQTPQKQEKEIVNKKVKLQEPEIVKQLETDVQLQRKMASSGTVEDTERSEPTMNQ
ncbi:MAG: hypothetical protein GTO45_41110, partial [Candidatus Aminicenantes bacterium]|nr:hypothetical protein [Candidatus Aminicenantes bacterium]NIM85005.1 hypothetical protein [Candidatus Aminicenantes bacterium]NIN24519.1 hypothetical protein [Candidatus Aminicenantes bacterium]NIN48283.1 hypothetical protein [Candidatus Aminicenantes bacterium]NIN91186.1 hypothetical protein [Candidatus Aminicenantes bacterium]